MFFMLLPPEQGLHGFLLAGVLDRTPQTAIPNLPSPRVPHQLVPQQIQGKRQDGVHDGLWVVKTYLSKTALLGKKP